MHSRTNMVCWRSLNYLKRQLTLNILSMFFKAARSQCSLWLLRSWRSRDAWLRRTDLRENLVWGQLQLRKVRLKFIIQITERTEAHEVASLCSREYFLFETHEVDSSCSRECFLFEGFSAKFAKVSSDICCRQAIAVNYRTFFLISLRLERTVA